MFRHVPITFLYIPPTLFNDRVVKLYVPMRSVEPSRYSVRLLYAPTIFLYVPIRSYTVPVSWPSAEA